MQNELHGRVAIVTGGGGGLGRAISSVLAEAGAAVAVADLRLDHAEEVAQSIRANGGTALGFRLDVSEEDFVRTVVSSVLNDLGRVDVLINNAGVDVTVPIDDLMVADWDRILGVNLRGPFLMTKEVLPSMRELGQGHIVNIVSTAAKRSWPEAAAYHASKSGLLGFSHALHAELRASNIKVTAIIAGGMRTPFLLDRFPEIDTTTLQEPRAVAEAVRFAITQPEGTVIPELMVLPLRETSWP